MYGEREVLEVLLGVRDPSTLTPNRPEGGDYTTEYEQWMIANTGDRDLE